MNWLKLLRHDLRCGLLRWRYLLAAPIFLLPCLACCNQLALSQMTGNWMDYMLYIFQGRLPVDLTSPEVQLSIPTLWVFVLGASPLLNLDYLLNDLTQAGQQMIIRSGRRWSWYLSKCVWNLLSCVLYLLLGCVTAGVFTLLLGGELSLHNTPQAILALFSEAGLEEVALTPVQGVIATVLLPLATLMALNLLQMALCLLLPPIAAFIVSLAVLLLSVYGNFAFFLGNGAMTVRSALLVPGGISPAVAGVTAGVIILLSAVLGCVRFQYTDILGLEE